MAKVRLNAAWLMSKRMLTQSGLLSDILNKYDEPHRFYHNIEHINAMLDSAFNDKEFNEPLFWAILFHDIVYNPKNPDNEEQSAKVFSEWYNGTNKEEIVTAIIDTKTHTPRNEISEQLCKLDLAVLHNDYETFIDFEHKIFKEYQFADYALYKEKRLEVLSKLGVRQEFLNYVKFRKPNIAVYAGSFNPFHKGHYNILQQAEEVFDKVIIARGINPDKSNEYLNLPNSIQFRQVERYNGLLTDFINKLGYDVTLIRGIRNEADMKCEQTQSKYLKEMKPNIKIAYFFCDKEYEHISSSAIRQLMKFGRGAQYLIP